MGDNQSSFFSRLYDFENNDNSKDINFEHVRHKCEPGQKSFVSGFLEKLAKRYADRRADEAKCNRQRPPATPKGSSDSNDDNSDDKDSKKKKKKEPETPKIPPPAVNDDDLLPRCFIKEQNPLAPPCCDIKSDDEDEDNEPCPPPGYPQERRVPGCGCDRCRKSGYHGRCCDRRTYAQQSAELPPRLEKA